MHSIHRLKATLCGALLAIASLVATPSAHAQDYPNRPVKLVVAQAAGGAADVLGRVLATRLSDALGQQVIVDNKAGANGIIGVEAVAKAPPDGYTLLLGSAPNLAINPALYRKLSYDPMTDLAPIAILGQVYYAVLVPANSPANTMSEFIAMVRAKPNQFNYGSGSSGARANIEIFNTAAKIQINHVPYKSNSQALVDTVGGRLDMIFETTTTAAPQFKTGKVKVLAITSPERHFLHPEIPAVAEAVPGYEYSSWVSVNAPAGIPPAVQQRLTNEIGKIMARPDVIEQFRALGFEPKYGNASVLATRLANDITRYKKAVKDANIPLE
ncbi:Bug family tripartite tricarboxylate transporter substrate binding protein [Ramlibacter sp.]|uniref:Bug family tripartite tricarboxylate transporter substrate binding protein n=1 Tax=Ramlibacter sp. TaxID=1917967 RepID=UPI003D0CDD41